MRLSANPIDHSQRPGRSSGTCSSTREGDVVQYLKGNGRCRNLEGPLRVIHSSQEEQMLSLSRFVNLIALPVFSTQTSRSLGSEGLTTLSKAQTDIIKILMCNTHAIIKKARPFTNFEWMCWLT